MSIFLEIHIVFTSHSCALTCGLLSCVFLANYLPKCQMSSGPCGTILNDSHPGSILWFAIMAVQTVIETSHYMYLCIFSLAMYTKGIVPLQPFFLQFLSIFLKFIHSLLLYKGIWNSFALTYRPLRLSCVSLDKYVPKCQMNLGPSGPFFLMYGCW